jgi:hypothetical protein
LDIPLPDLITFDVINGFFGWWMLVVVPMVLSSHVVGMDEHWTPT